MKKTILIFLLAILQNTYAQKNSGIIVYKVVSLNEINIPKTSNKSKRNKRKLESFFKKSAAFELVFKGDKSLYKRKIRFDKNGEREKINFYEIFGGGNGVFYNEKGRVIESVNKYDELFLIKYDSDEWKISQENKKIGGYLCYKAISKNKKNTIVWFTPNIPLQFGPKQFKGLPGLILEVQMGKISIIASEIVFKEVDNIKQTFKGTVISESDYKKKIREIAKDFGF